MLHEKEWIRAGGGSSSRLGAVRQQPSRRVGAVVGGPSSPLLRPVVWPGRRGNDGSRFRSVPSPGGPGRSVVLFVSLVLPEDAGNWRREPETNTSVL